MKKVRKNLNRELGRFRESFFPSSEELLEQAFSKTSKIMPRKRKGPALEKRRSANYFKAKTFGESLQKKIYLLSKQFPEIDGMNPFYVDFLGALTDVVRLKKNLARLKASSTVIKRIRHEYGKKIYSSRSTAQADRFLNEAFGRMSSVVKKLRVTLKQLKEDAKKIRETPSIDFSAETVVLAGFPNVGKTTLLKKLTGAKAEIAAYAFTTKGINSGFFEAGYHKMQVLDTPGLLDRETESKVEGKAIAALKPLATVVVFVMDPTQFSGFSVEKQVSLLNHIREKFAGKKIIVVVNKADLASEKEVLEAVKAAGGEAIVDGEGSNALKESLEALFSPQKQAK